MSIQKKLSLIKRQGPAALHTLRDLKDLKHKELKIELTLNTKAQSREKRKRALQGFNIKSVKRKFKQQDTTRKFQLIYF